MFNKIRSSLSHLGNIAVKNGGGVSSYTYQLNPFKSVTKTPAPTTKTFAPGTKSELKNPPPELTNDQAEKVFKKSPPKLDELPAGPRPPVLALANKVDYWKSLVDDKTYFHTKTNNDRETLKEALHNVGEAIFKYRKYKIDDETKAAQAQLSETKAKEKLKGRQMTQLPAETVQDRIIDKHQPALRSAELATLTAAVAAAARPVSAKPAQIARALQILTKLDLEGAIKHMAVAPGQASTQPTFVGQHSANGTPFAKEDEDLAWRIAYKLASSESAEGFKLLQNLQHARRLNATADAAGEHPPPPAAAAAGTADDAAASTSAAGVAAAAAEVQRVLARHPELEIPANEVSAAQAAPAAPAAPAADAAPADPAQAARDKKKKEAAAEHSAILLRTFLRSAQMVVDKVDEHNKQAQSTPASGSCFRLRRRGNNQECAIDLNDLRLTPHALFHKTKAVVAAAAQPETGNGIRTTEARIADDKKQTEKKIFADLAGKAIQGVQQNFEKINQTEMLPDEPVPLNWAVNMVRNGFKSEDDPRYTFAEKRVEKLDTWIKRASAPTTLFKRVKRQLMPFREKTPFAALDASRNKEGHHFKVAESSGLAHNRAMVTAEKKLAESIEKSLAKHVDNSAVAPAAGGGATSIRYKLKQVREDSFQKMHDSDQWEENNEIVINAVRYEVMLMWSKKFLWGVSAHKLTEAEKTEIRDVVKAKFDHLNQANIRFDYEAIMDSELKKCADNPVTPDVLSTMAGEIKLDDTHEEAQLKAEVEALMELVKTGEVEHASVDLQGKRTKEAVKARLDAEKAVLDAELKRPQEVMSRGNFLNPSPEHIAANAESHRICAERNKLSKKMEALNEPDKHVINAKLNLQRGFKQFFKNAELGSQVTLSGGYAAGFNTGAITSIAQRIAVQDQIVNSLRPRVSLAGSGGKSAVFRMGCPTTGPVAFFGTQPRAAGSVGAGASVVLGTGNEDVDATGFGLSASADVGLGMDYSGARGVALVVPRLATGVAREKEATDQMSDTLDTILKLSSEEQTALDAVNILQFPPAAGTSTAGAGTNTAEAGASTAGAASNAAAAASSTAGAASSTAGVASSAASEANDMSKLKQVLQQHNNTSVSVIGTSREIGMAGNLSGSAAASMKATDVKGQGLFFGASAGLAAQYRRFTQKHVDETGFLKTRVSLKEGKRTTVTASGGINIGRGFTPFARPARINATDVTGASSDLVGVKADIYKKGFFIRSTMTKLDGEVSERSFRFKTYANAADFQEAVEKNIGTWTHRMAKRWYPAEYDADGDRQANVLTASMNRIRMFVDDAVKRADPKEEFSEYLEMSPAAVKQINNLQGMADFMREAGDRKQAAKIEKEINRLFEAAESWEEAFLVKGERGVEQHDTGLLTGVRYAATNAKVENKLHVFV